jgi:hypothetical protein
MSHQANRTLVVLVLLLVLVELGPFLDMPVAAASSGSNQHQTGFGEVLGNGNQTSALPALPQPSEYVPPAQRFLNLVRSSIQLEQSASQVAKLSATGTEAGAHVLDVPVQPATFGSSPVTPNYFEPSVVDLGHGAFEYNTSFGFYDLTPTSNSDDYVVSFRTSDMASGSLVSSTAFVLLENSSGNGKWNQFPNLSNNAPSVSSTQFKATWDVQVKGKAVAQIILTVDFGRTSLPEISTQLVRSSFKVDSNCVDPILPNPLNLPSCDYRSYWDDAGLKDFQWQWLVIPSAGNDVYKSHKSGNVSLSSAQSLDGTTDAANTNAAFTGAHSWAADWASKGMKPINFTKKNAVNQQSALAVLFDVNDASIDPTFGVSTTGSTSYPSTNVKLNDNANSASAVGTIFCTSISTGANPITITVLQAKWNTAGDVSKHFGLALYDDSTGPHNLLASVFNTVSGTGWLTEALSTAQFVAASTKVWVCFQNENAANLVNYNTSADAGSDYRSFTYNGAFPNPFGTVSTNVTPIDTGVIYVQIEGYTEGSLVQSTANGVTSSFSFYTHTGAAGDHFTLGFYSSTPSGSNINAGDTGVEATDDQLDGNTLWAATRFTLTAFLYVQSIVVYHNAAGVGGHWRLGIYPDVVNAPLMVETGELPMTDGTGWVSHSVTGTLLTPRAYWIIVLSDVAAPVGYVRAYTGAGRYGIVKQPYTYGPLPASFPSGATSGWSGPISAYVQGLYYLPYQRLWYSSSTGSVSSTWNVVTYASGTTDNGWAGTVTAGQLYWFMWQWDNVASGPSYAAGATNTGIFKAQTYGTLDSTWSGGALSAENWSMYLTFSTLSFTWQLSNNVSNDMSASTTLLTIDAVNYAYSSFPLTLSWASGSTHSVAAATTIGTGRPKQYIWSGGGSGWTNGDGLSGSSGTYTAPASNTTITVGFTTQYQITGNLNGKGTVAKNPSATWYNASSSVAVTIGSDGSNSSSTRNFINSITGSGSGSYSGIVNPFTVTMNSAVNETVAWYAQYDLKIQALDKNYFPTTVLKTSAASMNVSVVGGGTTVLLADANGYMDFGWFNSSKQVYLTAKYQGTVVNSTWHLSPYTISSVGVYQWKFEYDAHVTLGVTPFILANLVNTNVQFNFTSYYINSNSSTTFTSGTAYVNSTSQAFSAGWVVVQWPTTAALYGSGKFFFNATDGFLFVRTATSSDYHITINSVGVAAPVGWNVGVAQTIQVSIKQNATIGSVPISIANVFVEEQLVNPNSFAVIQYQDEPVFLLAPGTGTVTKTYTITYFAQLNGAYLLRAAIYHYAPASPTSQLLGKGDVAILISSTPVIVNNPPPQVVMYSVASLPITPAPQLIAGQNVTVDLPIQTAGTFQFKLTSLKFYVPNGTLIWVQPAEQLPKSFSTTTAYVKVLIAPPKDTLTGNYLVNVEIRGDGDYPPQIVGSGGFWITVLGTKQAQPTAPLNAWESIGTGISLVGAALGVAVIVKRSQQLKQLGEAAA